MCSILVAFFQLLNFVWHTVTSDLKTNETNIIGDVKHSVLWHSVANLVNFIRHLTSIIVLCLYKLKHENCSQQYRARQVFIDTKGKGSLLEFELYTVKLLSHYSFYL